MYQALYRKYRPQTFDDVYGQTNIVNTLKNAIINNKLSHAYLFCGPRGTGKTSVAKIIARTINCENLVDATPCNKCVNCTQNTTDIIEIDAASNNGVDEIRELKNKISLVPTYGKYKIYIIDEVHMLTISAFNALLKTLEEPPKHIIFILATTDPEKVPPTIISRCQRFDFKRITIDAILNRLKQICKEENIEIEDNALYEIARISDGGLRDAVNLLDQAYSYTDGKITINEIHELNGTLTSYEIEEFFKYYLDNDLVTILNKITDYNNIGKNLVKLAQEFMIFLRNTVIYIKAPNYLEENNIDTKPYISISQSLGSDKILMLINELNKTINDMKISQNPKLIFELLFIKNVGNKNISQEVNSGKNATNQANVIKEEENFEKANILGNNDNTNISQVKEKKLEASKQPSNLEENEIYNSENVVENNYTNGISQKLKNQRIENTLAKFSKSKLLEIKNNISQVRPLLINNKYSQYVSLLLDGSIRAASDNNLLFMYEINSDAQLFNNNTQILEEIIEKSLGNNYKLIAVNLNEWNKIKDEFNSHTKAYVYKEEEIEKKVEKKDSVEELFENIIEYR